MGIILKETGGNSTPMEVGVYLARVARIVDMGIQEQTFGDEIKPAKQVLQVTFEFPTELVKLGDDERPRWLSKSYPVSFHEKSGLTALLKAIDPDGSKINDSVEALLGSPCQVSVEHTDKGKAKVAGVNMVMKGLEVPELADEPVAFSMDEPNMEVFATFPDWMKESLREAINYNDSALASLDTVVEAR